MSDEARTDRAADSTGSGGKHETTERNRGDGATGKDVLLLVPGLAGILYALFGLEAGSLPFHGLTAAALAYLAVLMSIEALRSRSSLLGFAGLFLLVTVVFNLQRGLLEQPPLWFLGLTGALFLVGVVGGFAILLHLYRGRQDERERRLFAESGLLAFATTLLGSLVYWMLGRLPDVRGAHSRLAFEMPEPSAIWVVFFGLGAWAVAWAVLRWRRY